LVKEAGGMITDFDGHDAYFSNGNVVAGNLRIQKALLEIIRVSHPR